MNGDGGHVEFVEMEPVRLRRSPLFWLIDERGGWYRALPVWSADEFPVVMVDKRREFRAGIRRIGGQQSWVPGERAVEGWAA